MKECLSTQEKRIKLRREKARKEESTAESDNPMVSKNLPHYIGICIVLYNRRSLYRTRPTLFNNVVVKLLYPRC